MTLMIGSNRERGFALPTILILTVVLLMMLLAAMGAMSTVRQALVTQQYDRMARLAAESGVNYATDCLSTAEMIIGAVWIKPTTNLAPNTDCKGVIVPGAEKNDFILNDTDARLQTTFRVPAPVMVDGTLLMKAQGEVRLLRASDSQPWKTYKYEANVKIGTDIGIKGVYFGYAHDGGGFFATINYDGTMLATGANKFGQLGNGSLSPTLTPTPFKIYAKKPVKAYASILSLGFALFAQTDDGEIWGAGLNTQGQLGSSNTSDNVTIPVRFEVPSDEKIVNMVNLSRSTLVITEKGRIYASGLCVGGQLGIGYCTEGSVYRTPQLVQGMPAPDPDDPLTIPEKIVGDAAGVRVLTKGGSVYGWGYNRYGEMATGNRDSYNAALKMGTFGDPGQPIAKQIQFDGDTTYILDSNGDVWCAGRNDYGQLGVPASNYRMTLEKIPGLPAKITKVSTDQWSVSMVGEDGNVYSLGLNNAGQLGNGEINGSKAYSTPQRFLLPAGVKAVDVVNASLGSGSGNAPYNNVIVQTADGQVYGAGGNVFGQLGTGSTKPSYVSDPGRYGHMRVFDGNAIKATEILAGFGETIIRSTSGRIYTVGNNQAGQLGDGTTTNDSTPRARQYVNMYPPRTYF